MALDIPGLFAVGESSGVFDYMLPGLLLFAVIFGILSATKAFGNNKGVHTLIGLIVAVLALRVGFVQSFFLEIFPRTGVALAVILVLLILTSMFTHDKEGKWAHWVVYGIAVVAFVIVLFNSFSAVNFFNSDAWDRWGTWVVFFVLLIGGVAAVIGLSGSNREEAAAGHS